MATAIFRAPSHHELYLTPDSEPIYGGEEFTLPEGAPLPPNCELVSDESESLDKLKRDEIEKIATDLGVEDPEKFHTKQELIEAVEAAETEEEA